MKIVYSKKFEQKYPTNPVENPDRVSLSAQELRGYEFMEPEPASLNDIVRIHGREHIEIVQRRGLYEAASLAVDGCLVCRVG